MGDASRIEWTDATWNPIVGCSLVSPGCTHCYAMTMAARIEAMQPGSHYAGTTMASTAGPVWTGKVALAPEHILTQPLRWRKPRRIFVNSMADLFHESVPDAWIDQVFAVMALSPQHTFQVLTKRAARMRGYLESRSAPDESGQPAEDIRVQITAWLATPSWRSRNPAAAAIAPRGKFCAAIRWPLPNVWLGVSAEDQRRADERRDDLAAIAAAGWHTFVSYEPALGPVDWAGWEFLSWLISGGESGPKARPSHPDWHRAARDFCARFGTPFFFKQWGEWHTGSRVISSGFRQFQNFQQWVDKAPTWVRPEDACLDAAGNRLLIGADFMAARDAGRFPVTLMRRVGKANAGRTLDGRVHNDMPGRISA